MTKDPLLDFYERELAFIQEEGREFAKRYPKIAGRLRLSDVENIEDPHVRRLIEAFALLCARLRLKVQDEFPEICHSLLQAIYPQYLAPIPPIAICQLQLTDLASEIPGGRWHKRGETLGSDYFEGMQATFKLCYDTQVLPLSVDQVEYFEPPFSFEVEPAIRNQVEAAIRVRLSSLSPKLPLELMKLGSLRMFLGGTVGLGAKLYGAIFGDTLGIGFYNPENRERITLPTSNLRHVGFQPNQSLIIGEKDDPRTNRSYQILWEFFAAQEKFRFVDIACDSAWKKITKSAAHLDIIFLLKKSNPEIKRELRKDSIRLGCSPIINLFDHRADAFRLTEARTEYRIRPSARNSDAMEILSIESVKATSPGGGETKSFRPFYQPSHFIEASEKELFWNATRRRELRDNSESDRGTEVYLTLVDMSGKPQNLPDWTLSVTTTCCNRDFVARLPSKPRLTLSNAGGAVTVELLTTPTPTQRPLSTDEYYWRLISHLSLNHFMLQDTPNGAEALREILMLYNPLYVSGEEDDTRKAIQSIVSVKYSRTTARVRNDKGSGFCRGVHVEIWVDDQRLVGTGPFLFATILDYFFSLYATINSFTKLTVRTDSRKEIIYDGQPRIGTKCVI